MINSPNLYANLHEFLLTDYLHVRKSNSLMTLIGYMENAPSFGSPNVFLMIRPRGFGLSLGIEAIYSVITRDKRYQEREHDEELIAKLKLPHCQVLTLNLKKFTAQTPAEFAASLIALLQEAYWENHVSGPLTSYTTPKTYFANLIEAVAGRAGHKVALLIDNYDIPFMIASAMDENIRTEAISTYLEMLNVIKHSEDSLRWALLSGHAKFSLASELSEGLPLVHDLSREPAYETLFGFTREEVEQVFGTEIRKVAPHQGTSYTDYLYSLEHSYGGFTFSDNMVKVMCPACINHALTNDGMLYTYSANGNYRFLARALSARNTRLDWLFDRDGQDPLFGSSITLQPKGAQLGSLLLQQGFATVDKFTEHLNQGISTWRYRYTCPNEDMRQTLMVVRGQIPVEQALRPIRPRIADARQDDYFDTEDIEPWA